RFPSWRSDGSFRHQQLRGRDQHDLQRVRGAIPARRWPRKKRVKKLGVYELVLCDYSPRNAANASKWPETATSNLSRLARYESEEKARLAPEAAQLSSSF